MNGENRERNGAQGLAEKLGSERERLRAAEENVREEMHEKADKIRKNGGMRGFLKNLLDIRGDMMSYEEIEQMMNENTVIHGSNMWILMLAIFIASIGLNVNSTAVIIGAMLVSPLMSGIMTMGYSLAVRDLSLLKKAAARFATQVAISLITSTIYFAVSPLSEPTSEMIARTSPTIWDVMIALFGGIAGMIGNTRRVKGNVIPGVAIATALMPPLCTVGYGIASRDAKFILGAFYLFLINTLFIALSTAFVTIILRVPKHKGADPVKQKKVNRVVGALTVVAIIPSVYIGAMTVVNSVVSNNISSYISNEFVFSDTQVVLTSTDSASKVINVSLVGEHISAETIDAIRGALPAYGLGDYTLRVTQNMIPDFSEAQDTDRVTIALQESQINQLQAQLDEKDAEYKKLEQEHNELVSTFDSFCDFGSIAKKAAAIFTELNKCRCGIISSEDGDHVVLLAEALYPPDEERVSTVKNWLMTETGSDKCDVYIEAELVPEEENERETETETDDDDLSAEIEAEPEDAGASEEEE